MLDLLCFLLVQGTADGPASPDRGALPSKVRAYEKQIEALENRLSALEEGQGPQSSSGSWLDFLSVTVQANGVGSKDDHPRLDDEGREIDDRIRLRQVDVDLGAPLGPGIEAFVIASLRSDPVSDYEARIQEGFVSLEELDWLQGDGWSGRVRLGRFRSSFGRLNRVRQFQLPQASRPLAFETFLGQEGLIQNGVAAQLRFENPSSDHRLAINLEAIGQGDLPIVNERGGSAFASTANLDWLWSPDPEHTVQGGLSLYRGKQGGGSSEFSHLLGVDLLLSGTRSNDHTYQIGGELFQAYIGRDGSPDDEPLGFYLWAQSQLSERWFANLRAGSAEELDDPSSDTQEYGVFFSFVNSDQLRFGLGWDHQVSDLVSRDGADTLWVEMNFAFGSHPRRPFWADATRNVAP